MTLELSAVSSTKQETTPSPRNGALEVSDLGNKHGARLKLLNLFQYNYLEDWHFFAYSPDSGKKIKIRIVIIHITATKETKLFD